jgi:tetratricopeptide (TPR) repeat protein
MADWAEFTHDAKAFTYDGDTLESNWQALHGGDHVSFPDETWTADCLNLAPEAAPADFDGNIEELALLAQDAWRSFHAGAFEQAVALSSHCGMLAHACANKASGVYAFHLETNEQKQHGCYLHAIEHAEHAVSLLPDDANSHYFRAFNLGRYGQSISIVEALRRGMAGKIHESLSAALELEPDHAEAHTAMGMYHAEIINKVGKMIGGMTYGTSIKAAESHLERAVELSPESPIAHIEYANGLYLLFADKRLDEVTELYIKASEMNPRDAMEQLDIGWASSELE